MKCFGYVLQSILFLISQEFPDFRSGVPSPQAIAHNQAMTYLEVGSMRGGPGYMHMCSSTCTSGKLAHMCAPLHLQSSCLCMHVHTASPAPHSRNPVPLFPPSGSPSHKRLETAIFVEFLQPVKNSGFP